MVHHLLFAGKHKKSEVSREKLGLFANYLGLSSEKHGHFSK
jgi:hypothetical protein